VTVTPAAGAPAFTGVLAAHLRDAPVESGLVFYRDLTWSAQRFRDAVAQVGDVLGDRPVQVAIVMRNHPWHTACLAASLLGEHSFVVLSPLEPDERNLGDIRSLRPDVVVAERGDLTEGVREAAQAVGATLVELPEPGVGAAPVISAGSAQKRPGGADGVAIVMLTSGTTGPAKRVSVGYRDLDNVLAGVQSHYVGKAGPPRRSTPVICPLLPVTITGLWGLITALSGGAPIVLMDRFEPVPWAEQVRRHRPRTLNLPPAALRMILDAEIPAADLASVSAVWSGAAPLDPVIADRFEATYGVPVLQSYGATEFAGGLAGWNLGDRKTWGATKRPSVGRLHPGVEARVLDPQTHDVLPVGQTGLLCFRTPHSVGAGPEDWVRTNDLGRVDADGFLFVDGRADDIINRGGFKVSGGTLKNVLEAHPAVREAAVVGLPDERLGEVPGALVVTPGGAEDPSDADLDAWVRSKLPPYYAPTVLRRADAIPRNGAMKIVRPAVLALLTDEADS
jgi:acyl-coenzyme A synthetase/AMP-(fatty) acid ligase